MDNEKRRLVEYHIWRKLSGMTNDELRSILCKIRDGNEHECVKGSEQDYSVWEMISDAEHDARADMICKLTKRMLELSDVAPEDRCYPRSVRRPNGKYLYCETAPMPVH